MENEIMDMREGASEMMRNMSVNINIDLRDWPAATTIIVGCLSGVAICGINIWYKLRCNS